MLNTCTNINRNMNADADTTANTKYPEIQTKYSMGYANEKYKYKHNPL